MDVIKSYTALTEAEITEGKGRQKYVFSCPSSLSLSFAVWLVDDYTQKEPLGEVRVSLQEENIKAVKNFSGYYTLSGLPEGKYTLNVKSALYFLEERVVDTSSFSGSKDHVDPVIEIILKPRPLYPFPDWATLLRGMLAVESDLPADITVKATLKDAGWEIQVIPDEKGEFVFYFKNAVKGKSEIILEIKGEGIEKVVSVAVEEGQNTYVGLISLF